MTISGEEYGPPWLQEHRLKMKARTQKMRENKRLRFKGKHPLTEELWGHLKEHRASEPVKLMVSELDMELWRIEENK